VFGRDRLYGEIAEIVSGRKPGRERADERILVHTTGHVAHDIALAHYVYAKAKEQGRGIKLPAAPAPHLPLKRGGEGTLVTHRAWEF
jgi:ornithine cyclodeaminase